MNTLKCNAIGFVVGALMFLPVGSPTARADDDWEDRWEDYQEELEDRREEERERFEEWREDREEALEDLHEERAVIVPHENWRPRNRSTRYWQYEEELPPPRRYTREDRYYREPVYRDDYRDEVYWDEPPVYEYYSRPRYRYYGTPRIGYSEYGRERSVRVGSVQVFWSR